MKVGDRVRVVGNVRTGRTGVVTAIDMDVRFPVRVDLDMDGYDGRDWCMFYLHELAVISHPLHEKLESAEVDGLAALLEQLRIDRDTVLEEVEGWRKANDDLARRLDRAQIDIEAWKRAHQTLQERLHKAQSDVRLWKDANARQADSNQEHLKNVRAQRDDAYKRISELTTALAAIDASIRGLSIDLQPPVRRW